MSRRIEIELTSARDDGTFTWRAAGAREPRGTVPASLVGESAKVGDVLRVEAEFYLDGIEITAVVPGRGPRQEGERLELLGSGRSDEPLVTTTLARGDRDRRGRGDRRDRGDRGDRRDRDRGDRGERGEGRGRGDRRERSDREPRRSRPPRPEAPPLPVVERPKAKRLRPGRAHRTALLESLPEEQRPIAEQVVLGGLPAVRQAIEKQNAERKAAGEPAINAGPLLELAEKLVPRVRAAEWRDRAEAAQRDLEVLDLRDLRSVVSAADSAARDEESRALARELREGLIARVDAEHATWLEELQAVVDVGRIVRALRISSRPPKAGAPLPQELATKLVEGASAALTADAAPERWVAVLDALAFSPVRDRVIPQSLPTNLHDDVKATIARLATRVPKIAHIFEIEPDPTAPRPERRRPPKPKKPAARADEKGKDKPKGKAKERTDAEAPATEAPATEAPATEEQQPTAAPEAETATTEESAGPESTEAPEAEAPVEEQQPTTAPEPEAATAEPEAATAEPEAATAEPEAATAEPEAATAEPDAAPTSDEPAAVEPSSDDPA